MSDANKEREEIVKRLKELHSKESTEGPAAKKQKRPVRSSQKEPPKIVDSNSSLSSTTSSTTTSVSSTTSSNSSVLSPEQKQQWKEEKRRKEAEERLKWNPFIQGSLPSSICSNYKAAGVLVWGSEQTQKGEKKYFALLACENRKHKDKKKKRVGAFNCERSWSHFGGRREDFDHGDPKKTAMREFGEETGGIMKPFEEKVFEQVSEDNCHKIWIESGKHLIFMVKLPVDRSLSQLFLDRTIDPTLDCDGMEMDWIPIEELCTSGQFNFRGKAENFSYFLQIALKDGVRDWIKSKRYLDAEVELQNRIKE